MPLIQDYHVYCDETFIGGHVAFAFGALICTPRRSRLLEDKIDILRKNCDGGYFGEVKWNKLSGSNKRLYNDIIDVFLNDPYARFSVMKVSKGQQWREWGQSEEEKFFKTYYYFLMQILGPFSRYRVFADEKVLQKTWRWNTLHFLINRSRRDNWELRRRNIRDLCAIDSASDDLIQLTDLLLGGLVSTAKANAKMQIREKLADCVTVRTVRGNAKFRIWDWTPKQKR